MNTVVSILIGIVLFSAIIIFHELGHLVVAKKNGIKVTEFMLGMGPKIFSFTKGGTVYAFRLFLIGGACQMLGEDTDSKEEGAFNTKGPWARFATIIAGPIFNFIMAFALTHSMRQLYLSTKTKDTVRKERSIFLIEIKKILNKILANPIQCLKRVIHQKQVVFIPGMQS